ncbi:MAG: riboflavin synthase [Woeseiaceae bacterium]|jgi:riboflavin synthase
MFTGIIKATGEIRQMQKKGGDLRLTICSDGLDWPDYAVGESISVNGVCLTAIEYLADGFIADVSLETMDVTALANLQTGSRVNLEPAISLGERLGGHLVSGHVDCIGTLKARSADARSVRLSIDVPREYMRYIAKKGSVCIDGVSLTVNEVSDCTFGVNIIPHTATETIIGDYRQGAIVNVEVDLLARYLEKLLTADEDRGVTRDFLREHGYD